MNAMVGVGPFGPCRHGELKRVLHCSTSITFIHSFCSSNRCVLHRNSTLFKAIVQNKQKDSLPLFEETTGSCTAVTRTCKWTVGSCKHWILLLQMNVGIET